MLFLLTKVNIHDKIKEKSEGKDMYYVTYKNYYTQLQYSEEDNLFYGKLEGIKDLVSFHGTTIDSFEISFRDAVESYLDFCKEMEKTPERCKIPKLLSAHVIWNDGTFEKIVGYDRERKLIVAKQMDTPFISYHGISLKNFFSNYTNNVEEIEEKIKKEMNAISDRCQTFEEIIKSKFEKYVDAYDEICEQLRYIETTKKNERLYACYKQYEKQLLKGKRRKEKLAYRYMREETVEKMKEIVKTRKIIDGYKDIVRMKKLRKMIETDFFHESKWYAF